MPWFVARGVSANIVSIAGLFIGFFAAAAYFEWRYWPLNLIGLALSVAWLVADGLDGMIARATGTASPLGRILDGLCDHGVFALIYISLAASVGTASAWALAITAGAFHAVQSNIFEGERARFHARRDGHAPVRDVVKSRNPGVLVYEAVSATVDRTARQFDDLLRHNPAPDTLTSAYVDAAVPPLHLMSLESANMRVFAVFAACVLGDPRVFWWFEIVPLTIILIIGFVWHRSVEARLIHRFAPQRSRAFHPEHPLSKDLTEQ